MQFAKNLVLAVKVLINGSFSNAGFLGNLFNCSLMKALFAKNPSRRFQNKFPFIRLHWHWPPLCRSGGKSAVSL